MNQLQQSPDLRRRRALQAVRNAHIVQPRTLEAILASCNHDPHTILHVGQEFETISEALTRVAEYNEVLSKKVVYTDAGERPCYKHAGAFLGVCAIVTCNFVVKAVASSRQGVVPVGRTTLTRFAPHDCTELTTDDNFPRRMRLNYSAKMLGSVPELRYVTTPAASRGLINKYTRLHVHTRLVKQIRAAAEDLAVEAAGANNGQIAAPPVLNAAQVAAELGPGLAEMLATGEDAQPQQPPPSPVVVPVDQEVPEQKQHEEGKVEEAAGRQEQVAEYNAASVQPQAQPPQQHEAAEDTTAPLVQPQYQAGQPVTAEDAPVEQQQSNSTSTEHGEPNNNNNTGSNNRTLAPNAAATGRKRRLLRNTEQCRALQRLAPSTPGSKAFQLSRSSSRRRRTQRH